MDEQADIGVAFDGDGDRVAFVDEKGQIIPGDFITALIAREMLKKKPGAEILYDLRSSWVVPEEIEKAGGKAIECRVGHGLIKKQMREEGGYFAGELSSHYYFSDFFTTDNGDLAMLNMIKLLLARGQAAVGDRAAPAALLPLRRDQLRGQRHPGGARAAQGQVRPIGEARDRDRRLQGRVRRLVVQRPRVQHRAAHPPEPRGQDQGEDGREGRGAAEGDQKLS